ncbi:MAG: PspC domain-containing protein, partial [Chloroflexota bacterium]|nr:PspC domain-containing protein [Chloroflexota bacterium]
MNLRKRLYRSRTNRVVAGVAGGMADYLGIDPTIVRILWVLAFLPGGVPGLALYVLC